MRAGLVLGGGGVVGAAYHAGALTALEYDLGWDARSAEIVVGTSAGSVVGTLLRLGVSPSDLAAHSVAAYGAATHPLVRDGGIPRDELPLPPPARGVRWPRLPDAALVTQWLARPWALDPLAALSTFLPDGNVELRPHLGYLDAISGGRWPERPLWLCAVCRRDLRRITFGRNDLHAPLSAAVAASCAIPGYMTPVRIGDDQYVDGGVHSPTNADVLRGEHLDLVVVLSPMSAERVSGYGTQAAVRRYADHKLRGEVRALRAGGTPVVVLAPGPEVLAHTDGDFLSGEHVVELVRESFLSTGRQLRQRGTRALVAPLSTRRPLAA